MTSKKEPDFAACYDLANEILIASTVIESSLNLHQEVIENDKMSKLWK